MKRPVGKLFVHLFAITGIAGTDLYIKKQIEEKKEMNCCEPICRGKLLLRRYHNRGAFLNLGEKNPQLVAAISVGMTVLAGLFFLSTFSFLGKGMLRWGLTMLLGGAFSNTYDRLRRKYVVDYVSFNVPWEAFRKIVFNIGDFAIMIGALVSVLSWISARYFCVLLGWDITGGACMTIAGAMLCLDHVLNALAPRLAGKFQVSTTFIKMVPLVLMAVVGTIVGILPGAGATIASFMCYAMENKLSKYPEKFGTGIIDGIAASETANNAATGGAMVPLLTLGIPGGNAAAVMMSALALKGVQMGPLLLTKQPEFLSATFITMIITNILMVVVAMGIAKVFAQILAIPYSYLGPIILMLATIGSYSEGGFVGVQVMVLAGVLGVVVKYMHLNSAAIVLGLVLGGMCEEHFSRAYLMNRANVGKALFGTPIAAVVMTACILMLLSPLYMPWIKKLISRKKA